MKLAKMLVAIHILGLAFVAFALTGCGQKYPEAYGLYVKTGNTWISIDPTKPSELSETPEILIFDSRLARSSDKPDDTITIRILGYHVVRRSISIDIWTRPATHALGGVGSAVGVAIARCTDDRVVRRRDPVGIRVES